MKSDHPELAKLQLSSASILGDVLVLLTPLLFIGKHFLILAGSDRLLYATALAIAAALLNGQHQPSSGDAVQNALLLSPTIFSIVFAAVLGRCSQSIALYMSQKGIQMKVANLHLSTKNAKVCCSCSNTYRDPKAFSQASNASSSYVTLE